MNQFETDYAPQAFHAEIGLLNHAKILADSIDASYSKATGSKPRTTGSISRLINAIRNWRERSAAKAMARRTRIDQIGVSARAVRPGMSAANAPHFSSAA